MELIIKKPSYCYLFLNIIFIININRQVFNTRCVVNGHILNGFVLHFYSRHFFRPKSDHEQVCPQAHELDISFEHGVAIRCNRILITNTIIDVAKFLLMRHVWNQSIGLHSSDWI